MTRPGDGVSGTAVRARAATLPNALVRPTLPAPCSHLLLLVAGRSPRLSYSAEIQGVGLRLGT